MKKDLLKPRFKLIANYPGNTRHVGSISIEDVTASYFRKFPANFKELKWWEEREEEELPRFIKHASTGLYCMIIVYIYHDDGNINCEVKLENGNTITISLENFLPATESEYSLM